MYVGVVCVVDKCTAIDAFLHLQAHSNRFKFRHTFAEILNGNICVEGQHCYKAGDTVLNSCIVDKLKSVTTAFSFVFEVYGSFLSTFLNLKYVQMYAFDALW